MHISQVILTGWIRLIALSRTLLRQISVDVSLECFLDFLGAVCSQRSCRIFVQIISFHKLQCSQNKTCKKWDSDK